ncbi:neutral protease 2 [Peziza echinospora]|nr:neutral protease 2 [Peziza echinospora]
MRPYFLHLAGLLALVASVIASPVPVKRSESPLVVELAAGEGSVVQISVKNTGAKDLNILKLGSFLSNSPVEKVDIYHEGVKLDFKGIYLHHDLNNLDESAFTLLPSGETITTAVELAGLYDFPATGSYQISTRGALIYSDLSSGRVKSIHEDQTQVVAYESDNIDLNIDLEAVQKDGSFTEFLQRRVVLTSCSASRKEVMSSILPTVVTIANQAAAAAEGGEYPAKFAEFFKTNSASTMKLVADRLKAVSKAAASINQGQVKYYCSDDFGYCEPNVIAWTQPSTNTVANCDYFYNNLRPLSRNCNAQDQATTIIHELTHAPGVYTPHTQDYAYGHDASTKLSQENAAQNADTYAIYAQHVYLGC